MTKRTLHPKPPKVPLGRRLKAAIEQWETDIRIINAALGSAKVAIMNRHAKDDEGVERVMQSALADIEQALARNEA